VERSTARDGGWDREAGDAGRVLARTRRIDRLCEQMRAGMAYEAMDCLVAHLHVLRAGMPAWAWHDYVAKILLRHPLKELLHRDPFTLRAYAKPQGGAGDALLVDMAYSGRHGAAVVDAIGEAVFRYVVDGSLARALRNRRRRVAMAIDEAIRLRADARVLALGAGHLREIELVRMLGEGFIGEILAVDQDEECLAVIEYAYAARGVCKLHVPLDRLLAGQPRLRGFDLVYAAGLSDRLSHASAQALAERMFEMLNPHGCLLIANLAPDLADAAYLESYMDRHPVYRGERDMLALVAGLARADMADVDLSFDAARSMSYLTVRRGGAGGAPFRQERLREARAAFRDEWLKRTNRRG
jgi:hypothetical protein